MIVDYADIAAAVNEALALIDHRVLNEIPGLGNPTTELLAPWLFDQIKSGMPQLFRIEVAESATTGCVYEPEATV
jgi:6-pyruvoyltetrahydropterin/6-carboxytetrahydropterin synthase